LLNTLLEIGVKRLHLRGLARVEELASHAGLHRDSKRALELATGLRHGNISGNGNDDLLGAVVVGSAFTSVLGFLNGSFLVTLVEMADDVGVELLNLFFKGRKALDSKIVVLTRRNLNL
jgi:hypothetical protein